MLLLLGASVLVECIRTCDNCYSSQSVFVEPNNYLKVLHFAAMVGLARMYSIYSHEMLWLNCTAIAVCTVLLIVRIRTAAYSK